MDWSAEISELHAFFESYFLGRETSMERAEAALAPGFAMITPDGALSDRAAIIEMIRAGHGHSNDLRIETSDHQLVLEGDDGVVATYVETHHLSDDRRNDRRTTVVFVVDPDGPNGLRWKLAHETWIGFA